MRWRAGLSAWCALTLLLNCSDSGPVSEAAPQTWAEIRDGCVVRQQFDFSCGLASLATMLQFEFGMDTSERELLEELLALASPSTVKTGQEQAVLARATDRCGASVSFAGDAREELLQNGASLLQLWCLAQMHGKQAFVRQADLSFLRQNLDRPIIVHLKLGENLKHFAVLRKIDGRWVHLADPSRGCKVYLLSEFQEEWQRPEVLLLHEPTDYVPLSGRLGGTAAAAEIERRRQEAVRILHQ